VRCGKEGVIDDGADLYIIFFTILGAVVIFIPGRVEFVDAIFFAS
jgi:hypothetical protein